MIRFDDYPYAQVKEALGTVLGRVGLVVLAALGGSILGGLTANRSLEDLWLGVIGFPGFGLASIFFGVGYFVFPVLLLYTIVSIRCQWPLKLTLICSLLMWWNIHQTIRWTLYDSPMAKQQQKSQAKWDKAMEDAARRNSLSGKAKANKVDAKK